MSKITGDMTKMAAQIPALFETLSGMPLSDLFREGAADRGYAAEGERYRAANEIRAANVRERFLPTQGDLLWRS